MELADTKYAIKNKEPKQWPDEDEGILFALIFFLWNGQFMIFEWMSSSLLGVIFFFGDRNR